MRADELRRRHRDKTAVRKETYRKILDGFFNKIRNGAEMGERVVRLTVPTFVIGYPLYDRAVARDYLHRQLERAGFAVSRMTDVTMGVTWLTGVVDAPASREAAPMDELDACYGEFANISKIARKHGAR